MDFNNIKIRDYLTYAEIQNIVNAVTKFTNWAERQTCLDMMVLYYVTDLGKEKIEEIGHEEFLRHGVIERLEIEISNYFDIEKAIDYTESISRSLIAITGMLNKSLAKVEKQVLDKYAVSEK